MSQNHHRYKFGNIFILCALFLSSIANATGESAQSFNLDGRLYSNNTATTPMLDSNVTVVFQILNPAQDCILYEETQAGVDSQVTNGYFNLQVGSAVGAVKRSTGDAGHSMSQIYANTGGAISGKQVSDRSTACSYTPVSGASRYVRMIVTPSSDNVARVLSPNMLLDSVPSAVVAERADSLQGFTPADLLQVNTTSPADLSQSHLENIFSTTNYPILTSLLAGSSSMYTKQSSNGTANIPSASSPSAPSAGQMWYDSGDLKYYDGSTTKTLGTAGSGVQSVIAGSGLTGGTITNTGTIAVDTGTTAGKIVQLDGSAKLPAVDGSALTNLNGSAIQSGTIGGATDINTTGSISTATVTTTGNIVAGGNISTATGNISAQNVSANGANFRSLTLTNAGTQSLVIQPPASITGTPNFVWPGTTGSLNQVLTTDGAGVLSWSSVTTGTVTNVTGTAPVQVATGGTTPVISVDAATTAASGVVTLAANGGTIASTVVQATDSRLTNARTPVGTTLNSAEMWVGSAGNVAAAVTMSGDATLSNAGALTLANSGVSAGTYTKVTVDAKGRVTGNGVTNLTDIKSTVAGNWFVATGACSAGEQLSYSSVADTLSCQTFALTSSQVTTALGYTPANGANYVAKAGDTMTGALNLPSNGLAVGTSQLVVSGGNVGIGTTSPATKLDINGTIKISNGAESCSIAGDGGMVRYNAGSMQFCNGSSWQTLGVAGSGITSLVAGTGLTGGTITTTGTISVDVGTTANKIVQLDGSSKLPAVDGSALTNLSAVQITAGTLPIARGGTGQTTAAAALNAFLPTQTGNSGKVLQTDGTNSSWVTPNAGVVTSISGTAPIAVGGTAAVPVISISDATTAAKGAVQLAADGGTTASTVVQATDARLSDARTPVGTSLTASQIWVGNGSNQAAAVAMSGDATLSNTGALTLNTVPVSKGGTGLTALGTSNQVLGVNNAGTASEYKTITAGAGVTVTHGVNSITINATGSGGTVTSVGLSMPSIFSVTNSPVTSAGTLTASLASQTARTVFAAPTGAAGAPSFRSLNIADISSTVSGGWLGASGACAAGTRLEYSSINDNLTCQSYSITSAQVNSALGYTPANGANYVAKAGDTMTGALNLPSNGLAVGTSQLVVSGGNVGIGTTSPLGALHVVKSGSASSGTTPASNSDGLIVDGNTSNGISILTSDTGLGYLTFGSPSRASGALLRWDYTNNLMTLGTNNTGGQLAFATAGAGERMRITSNGLVGIGTTDPTNGITYNAQNRILGVTGSGSDTANANGVLTLSNNRTTTAAGDVLGAVDFISASNGTGVNRLGARIVSSLEGSGGANNYGAYLAFNTKADNTAGSFTTTERMRITSAGNVGIGTTSPSEKLHVVGNLRVQGSTDCTLGNGSGGTNCTSDIRLKTNIQEIENPLQKILSLRGVEFDWNEKSQSPGEHAIGVIAQDVEKQFPTAVIEDSHTGYKKVDYAVLVAPVIQAFKEFNKRITELFSASENHSRRLASVEAESAAKDKEIAKLKADAEKQKQENAAIRAYLCAKDPKAAMCK